MTTVVLAALLAIVVVAGLWRLNQGPVSLNFLEPHLSWSLGSEADSLTLTIHDPALAWGGVRRPVDLRAGPVVISDHENRIVVEVEQVSVGLAWLELLHKKVALSWLEVKSTHFRLLRTEDGRFVVGFEAKDRPAKRPSSTSDTAFQELLKKVLTSPEPVPPFERLTYVSITGSRATIDDRVLGRVWSVPELDLHLRRKGSDLRFSVDGTVDLEAQKTELRVRGNYDRVDQRLQSTVSVKALRPSSIARFVPAVEKLQTVDVPLDVKVETDLSISGGIHTADVDLRSEIGRLDGTIRRTKNGGLSAQATLTEIHLPELAGLLPQLATITEPVDGTLSAALSPERRLEKAEVRVQTAMGQVAGTLAMNDDESSTVQVTLTRVQPWKLAELVPDLGRIHIPINAQAEAKLSPERSLNSVKLEVTGGSGTISVPEVHGTPFRLEGLDLQAKADQGLRSIRISNLKVQLPGLSITATAHANRGDQTTRITADAGLSELDVSRSAQYWPSELVPDVLEWISTNITAGTIAGAKVHAELSLPSDLSGAVRLADLHGSFAFDDLTVAYLAPMPAATGLTGTATFTDRGFEFDVAGGAVRDIAVASATVGIGPFSGFTRLSVDAKDLNGPVRTAIEAIAGQPLELIGKGLPQPHQFAGTAMSHLMLDVPLSDNDPKPLAVSGTSQLKDVGVTGWVKGYELSRGDLGLEFDLDRLDLEGTARVNGVPATFSWHENLMGGPIPRTVNASATLDDDERQAVGIPPVPQVSGPVHITADLTGRADGSMDLDLKCDLNGTALNVAQLGWSKPPGVSGQATAHATIGSDWSVTVDPYRVDAGGLRSRGILAVAPGFTGLRRLEVTYLAYDGNRVAGSLDVGADGGMDIRVSGSRFDIGPLTTSDDGKDEPPAKDDDPSASGGPVLPKFNAHVTLEELVSGKDHSLGRFTGDAPRCHRCGPLWS